MSSHTFDIEGYDRELDLHVRSEGVPEVLTALGLSPPHEGSLLAALQSRFTTFKADSEIANFLQGAGIPFASDGYTKFP